MDKEQLMLRNPEIFPSDEILQKALGVEVFKIYSELVEATLSPDLGLFLAWRYYKDGKSWLAKFTYKKKTVFWLSVWRGYFKISFYFTERTRYAVEALKIDKVLLAEFAATKPAGKLLPLLIDVSCGGQLADLQKIIKCKKSLK